MHTSFRYFLFTSTMLSLLVASSASAAPQGGSVSAGSATIGQNGSITTITQGSDRAAIDWRSFDVGAGERVDFRQPSASSITLNRIHDQKPSEILGSITANGQVILANPNGMIFGKGSKVDVGGLVATTADIGNRAFMQGGPLAFDRAGNPDAKIINEGTITARDAGLVSLIAPTVENRGWVSATLGKVHLAGAETATVDLYGDGLLSIAVTEAAKRTLVQNSGTVVARAGEVLLTAAQAEHLVSSAVNLSGVADVSASQVDPSGVVTFGDGKGGGISASGRDITLQPGAVLNASGPAGGGTIQVGGGWQGRKLALGATELANARTVTVKQGASLRANATRKGDGGTVVAWSDGATVFDGRITAKGGQAGGNGGRIETSGKENLGLAGSADASAPYGKPGEWLLDPRDVVIQNNAQPGAENNVSAGGGTIDPPSDTYRISAESISTALSSGNNVTITTGSTGSQTGNITLGTATISSSANTDVTLTLKAANSIVTTGTNSITGGASGGTGKLHTILWSDVDNSGLGVISLGNTTITTNGGDFVAAGGLDDGANGGTAGDGRPDNYTRSGNGAGLAFISSSVDTLTGSIIALGHGWDNPGTDNQRGILLSGAQLRSSDGNITLRGVGGSGDDNNNGVQLANATVSSARGIITVNGTGGSDGDSDGNLNAGVRLDAGSLIESTGTGADAAVINIIGTGGAGHLDNYGIVLLSGAKIKSHSGAINIDGTGGGGTGDPKQNNFGFYLYNSSSIETTGPANVDIIARSTFARGDVWLGVGTLTIGGPAATGAITIHADSVGTISAAGGGGQPAIRTTDTVTIAPRTISTGIGLAGGAGSLNLSTAWLDGINAGNLVIGRPDGTGTISLGSYSWRDPVSFTTNSPGYIDIAGPQYVVPGSDASLTFNGATRIPSPAALAGLGAVLTFNGPVLTDGPTSQGSSSATPPAPVPLAAAPVPVPAPPTPPSAGEAPGHVPADQPAPPAAPVSGTAFAAIRAQEGTAYHQTRTGSPAAALGGTQTIALSAQAPVDSRPVHDRPLYTLSPELARDLEDE